ncbi:MULTISPECIES: hypothetical protein [unclassified Brevundimonas]|uniref:hypothetical protein n=1 Tax=unclassified Brevundimonas TaxID=2622653 RepID=UPI0025BA2371|nr:MULTISPECIES: hypothetical protein [unclassified Brevundimonas]
MKPITDILRDIRKGMVAEAAGEELAQVVRAVTATGKPGSLTIKLTVKPQKGDSEQVVISSKLSATTPTADMPEAIFFADMEGDLHRNDPRQPEMFRTADLGDAAVDARRA